MKPLRCCPTIPPPPIAGSFLALLVLVLALQLLGQPESGVVPFVVSIELSPSSAITIAAAAAPILPALPFLPFLPVTIADYLPRDTPASYIRATKQQQQRRRTKIASEPEAETPPVLVCIGDSLTHGSVSANWVSSLSRRLRRSDGPATAATTASNRDGSSYTVLNAGINSETAAAVRARLDDILRVRPDAVTLMVGTNDLIGSLFPSSAGVMYQRKLWWAQTETPSLEGYAVELDAIVKELDTALEASGTKIAVLSPPPLGEGGPTGRAWEQGARMATLCSDICQNASDRVTYIPLYDMVREEMVDVLSSQQQQQQQPPREFSYRDAIPLTSVVVPWRILLGQPFDEIQKANGYEYTIDGIHFGQEFADTVEEAVVSWMESW